MSNITSLFNQRLVKRNKISHSAPGLLIDILEFIHKKITTGKHSSMTDRQRRAYNGSVSMGMIL